MALIAAAFLSLRENRTLLIAMLRCFFDIYLLIPGYRQLPRPAYTAHLRPVGVIQNSSHMDVVNAIYAGAIYCHVKTIFWVN